MSNFRIFSIGAVFGAILFHAMVVFANMPFQSEVAALGMAVQGFIAVAVFGDRKS